MEQVYSNKATDVSIIKIFVKSRTKDSENNEYGYAIDIECCDVFLTDFIKEEVEKLSALVLSYAPEILIYRHIKDREPIMEFRASQFLPKSYKVAIISNFEEYLTEINCYSNTINLLSKAIIERISYLFGAYSLESY
jgi:hypothetical protein